MLRCGAVAIACADEVGRGALCGPVSVGVVVVTAMTRSAPKGVRDSKLLTPRAREDLDPLIRRWAPHAVGHATSREIDAVGIIAAMRLASHRALALVAVNVDQMLLDGNHDYVTPPAQPDLFGSDRPDVALPRVTTVVKADLRSAGVAAASILAKVARDSIMLELSRDFPAYGWADNKGYAAPEHVAALAAHGPTPHHRVSWQLPGAGPF